MVEFLPKEADLGLLIGRCVSIMHGYICKHNIDGLGISLPAWTDASIGNVIAFIHTDVNALASLSQQAYFKDMQDCGIFKLTEVTNVPGNCGEVMFKRNQAIGKVFAGDSRRRLERLKKRALARGEAFNPKKNTVTKEFELFHRIAISSSSKQQDFILHIQKEEVSFKSEPEFSKYGFATSEKFKGTVPDLSSVVSNN